MFRLLAHSSSLMAPTFSLTPDALPAALVPYQASAGLPCPMRADK